MNLSFYLTSILLRRQYLSIIFFEKSRHYTRQNMAMEQCDQIGRFIGLWGTFQSLRQQLICPNLIHSQVIFVKVSKSLIFLVRSFLGNFYRHLATIYWSHWTHNITILSSKRQYFGVTSLFFVKTSLFCRQNVIIVTLKRTSLSRRRSSRSALFQNDVTLN